MAESKLLALTTPESPLEASGAPHAVEVTHKAVWSRWQVAPRRGCWGSRGDGERVVLGMDATIAPGALVLVRHDRHHPCAHHRIGEVPLFQNVGMVDGLDTRRGEHRVVVVFWGIHSPIFGEPWVDAFHPDELVVVA